jgi:beta-lactamase regulating signal transducer with metallopeptidase domain
MLITISLSTILVMFWIILVLCMWAFLGTKLYLKQRRCSHLRYRENRACATICVKCGKNLGFIGSVRHRWDAEEE